MISNQQFESRVTTATAPMQSGIQQACVSSVAAAGVRVVLADGVEVQATIAVAGGAALRVGDRVLACEDAIGVWFVIGLLDADAVITRSGASARVKRSGGGEEIEVRDVRDQVIFRYDAETGHGALTMPKGDFAIRAPSGDISLLAGKHVRIQSPRLQVQAQHGEFQIVDGVFTGKRFAGTLDLLRLRCAQVHNVIGRLVERTRNVYRHVADLQQTTAGRVRDLIKGAWVVRSGRANLKASKDVRIDGEKINLG